MFLNPYSLFSVELGTDITNVEETYRVYNNRVCPERFDLNGDAVGLLGQLRMKKFQNLLLENIC